MHLLEIHEEVLAVLGKIGVCQSSLDLLKRHIDEFKQHKDGEPLIRLGISGDTGRT